MTTAERSSVRIRRQAKELQGSIPVHMRVGDNTGLPDIKMPSVKGLQLRKAEEALVQMNLHLHQVNYVADDSVDSGTVVSQSINSGRDVKLGSSVDLNIAVPRDLLASYTRTLTIRVPVMAGPSPAASEDQGV